MKILESELDLWEQYWCQKKSCLPDSVSTTLKSISFPCFPTIKTALRILGTLPVTSCSCERSFSALRKLKMYNRRTMCSERLSALALYKYMLKQIQIHSLIQRNLLPQGHTDQNLTCLISNFVMLIQICAFLLVEIDLIL